MIAAILRRSWLALLVYITVACLQVFAFIHHHEGRGDWFIYGRDTITQDAIQYLWVQQWADRTPGVIPMWISELQGGIPTIGSFFWTPFSPFAWPMLLMEYPAAQKLGWVMALFWAGMGGFALGRALRLRFEAALFIGLAWMLSGHLVTLIHAGHSQKIFALTWMGWALAGTAMAADPTNAARRFRGVGLAALSLGMMFICGHPQIAYTAAWMICLYSLFALVDRPRLRKRWKRHLIQLAAIIAVAGAASAVQLLPGIEMNGLSNRGEGVGYMEAVATSYPPGEISEMFHPRVKGSSVFGDVYTGGWGERIVSDYAGRIVWLFVLSGFLGAGHRWRRIVFWSAVATGSLVIGVGYHTPIYELLYRTVPGFSSFRSPGTFMCAAALAIPVLGGYGVNAVLEGMKRWKRMRLFAIVYTALLLLLVADLGWANRHFLHATSWDDYRYGYLGPTGMDLWLIDQGVMLETHDLAHEELRLRPILLGGRALNGYYPIIYGIKARTDRELEYHTPEWFAAWGVTRVLVRTGGEARGGAVIEARFPGEGSDVLRLRGATLDRLVESQPPVETRWEKRSPNEKILAIQAPAPADIRVAEIVGPGFEIYSNGKQVLSIHEPRASTRLSAESGETRITWLYRPASYRIGLFLSGIGLMVITFLLGQSLAYGPPRRMGLLEEGGPDPDYGGSLRDGQLVVVGHSHGEVREGDA